MLRVDAETWLTCGVEFSDGTAQLGAAGTLVVRFRRWATGPADAALH